MEIPDYEPSQKSGVSETQTANTPGEAEIQEWLVSYLAQLLEIEPEEIDVTIPFDRYGLESAAAAGLTGDLEDWLGCELDPTLLYDYPTIAAIAEYLANVAQEGTGNR